MSELITTNTAKGWYFSVPPPSGFGYREQGKYQRRIDDAIGSHNGRPLMKLAWAPDELRWRPHRLGDDPPGYTFPIFYRGKDEDGNELAAERWVLLERIEPEQFAPTWEAGRYTKHDGSVWDLKGPCPGERYTELRCHSYHDGNCCPCIGDACECGEQYDHCWGKYAEPDEHLMNWIRETAWKARQDPDVNPTQDIRQFHAPNAQRALVTATQSAYEKSAAEIEKFDKEAVDLFIKNPHTVSGGFKQASSGLYLPD